MTKDDDIERSLLDRVAELLATEAIRDAVGDVLTMLQSRIVELETRLAAETTMWIDGDWWLDLSVESGEIVYFYAPTGPEQGVGHQQIAVGSRIPEIGSADIGRYRVETQVDPARTVDLACHHQKIAV